MEKKKKIKKIRKCCSSPERLPRSGDWESRAAAEESGNYDNQKYCCYCARLRAEQKSECPWHQFRAREHQVPKQFLSQRITGRVQQGGGGFSGKILTDAVSLCCHDERAPKCVVLTKEPIIFGLARGLPYQAEDYRRCFGGGLASPRTKDQLGVVGPLILEAVWKQVSELWLVIHLMLGCSVCRRKFEAFGRFAWNLPKDIT